MVYQGAWPEGTAMQFSAVQCWSVDAAQDDAGEGS
jgi:hypothetical protein